MPISDAPFERFSYYSLRHFLKNGYHVVSRVTKKSPNNYSYIDYRFEAVLLDKEIASVTLEKVREASKDPEVSFALVKRVDNSLYDEKGNKLKELEHAFIPENLRGY
jgi:hypothetical protein